MYASTTLPNYSRIVKGENEISMEMVCSDGAIRMCRTEQYAEGFAAFLTKEDGYTYTNNHCYKTARKARNAAAKW